MTSGTIFDIKRYAIHDGPGIRTAVFMKGCPLSCWWCHNPEGQSRTPQLIFRANRCQGSQACIEACPRGAITWQDGSLTDWSICDQCGKCAEACLAGAREMVGREVSVEELMQEVKRDIPFYDQSGGGVTFTGGEPLLQRKFLLAALQACKDLHIHTAVDTSGQATWESFQSILPYADLFLYDIKHMDDEKHKEYTAVSNRKILDNLQKLSREGVKILIRVPLIPGINNDLENLQQCGEFLAALPHLEGVELMPYHASGEAKYQGLGMQYKLEHAIPPSEEQVGQAEDLLAGYKLNIFRHSVRRLT
jgi:pyruvate formate lyase activating enzyme